MKMENLDELYLHELQDLYDAEKEILKALPKMAKAATSTELKRAFQEHLEQSNNHVRRLEQIFDGMGEEAKATKCKGVRGIIDEGEGLMDEDATSAVADAALIGAAQKVEHYEIAVYGTLRTYAETLGHDEAAQLLDQTLEEEKAADQKLTRIAESIINPEAAAAAA